MSESAAESASPPRAAVEDYTPATLAALAEEQQLTDSAEQALEALLLALLLQGAAPTSGMPSVSASALRSISRPILYPMAIGVGMALLSRSRRRDVSDWGPLAGRVIDDAAEQIADALRRESSRPPTDMYSRDHDGPAGVDVWAKRVANTIVTAVTEGMKRGLRYRLGFTYKRWLTRLDERVRDSHRELEAVTLPGAAKFRTQTGAILDAPGDRSAPLSEWINCRCRLLWLRASDV